MADAIPKAVHHVASLPQSHFPPVADISANEDESIVYICSNCNKEYKHRQSAYKHKQKCVMQVQSKGEHAVQPATTIIQNTYIGSINIQKINSDNTTSENTINNTANNFNIKNNILYEGDKPLCVIRNPIEHESVDMIPKETFISLLAHRKYKECPNLTDYIMQNIISQIYSDDKNKTFYKPNLNKSIILHSTKDFKRTSIAEKELIEKLKFNVEKILCKLYFKHLDSMDIDTQIQCYKNIIHISREIERSSKRFNHYISNIIANNSMFNRESIINYFKIIEANNLNDIITNYFKESCKFQNMAHALPIKNSVGEIFKETPEATKSILDVMKTAQTQYSHENLPIQFQDNNDEKAKNEEHDAFIEKAHKLFDTTTTTTASESD
jgi:hypothetical protein